MAGLEHMDYFDNSDAADTYRYLNFDEIGDFVDKANSVEISSEMMDAAKKLQN